jgi:hypothetical protein
MNDNLGFSGVTKKYSTCIPFLPCEVTTELLNTRAEHEIATTIYYYYQVTPSNIHHPPSCSHILVGSEQVIKNGVRICIYSYIKNILKIHIS